MVAGMVSMVPAQFREIRRTLGMSQSQLGGLLGIDTRTVRRYERGETGIPAVAQNLLLVIWQIPGARNMLALKSSIDAAIRAGPPVRASSSSH